MTLDVRLHRAPQLHIDRAVGEGKTPKSSFFREDFFFTPGDWEKEEEIHEL